MAKDLGWIKLHRSSFNNRLYFSEPFTRWQAWCDLLLLANHKSGMFRVRGIKVEVLRGQTGFSSVELADRWRWSRGKVNRFLDELKDEQQIVQQKSNVTTLISIVNYDKYQADSAANSTQVGTHVSTLNGQEMVQQTDINKNDNNNNNKKERFNNNPKSENFNGLPEIKIGAAKELVRITCQKTLSDSDIISVWEVFKIQNLTGKKYYQDEDSVYSHFINWIKNQDFKNKVSESNKSEYEKKLEADREKYRAKKHE